MEYEELKEGDWVERIKDFGGSFTPGKKYRVTKDCPATDNPNNDIMVISDTGKNTSWSRGNFKKVSSLNMSSLTKKFRLLTMKEPQRTFVEAEVTTEEGVLTVEGRSLFEAFLLEKYGDEFKKEVVDPILAADKK